MLCMPLAACVPPNMDHGVGRSGYQASGSLVYWLVCPPVVKGGGRRAHFPQPIIERGRSAALRSGFELIANSAESKQRRSPDQVARKSKTPQSSDIYILDMHNRIYCMSGGDLCAHSNELRAHPDSSQGPADLQSAALATELCTRMMKSTLPL